MATTIKVRSANNYKLLRFRGDECVYDYVYNLRSMHIRDDLSKVARRVSPGYNRERLQGWTGTAHGPTNGRRASQKHPVRWVRVCVCLSQWVFGAYAAIKCWLGSVLGQVMLLMLLPLHRATLSQSAIIADTSLSLRLIRLEDPGPEIVSEAVVEPVPDLVELLAVVELALEYARTPPDRVHAVCGRLDAVRRALDVKGREWVPVGREAEHEGHVV